MGQLVWRWSRGSRAGLVMLLPRRRELNSSWCMVAKRVPGVENVLAHGISRWTWREVVQEVHRMEGFGIHRKPKPWENGQQCVRDNPGTFGYNKRVRRRNLAESGPTLISLTPHPAPPSLSTAPHPILPPSWARHYHRPAVEKRLPRAT